MLMISTVHRYVLPAAYALLPTPMDSPAATAMLLTIGMQESRFDVRHQVHGPAVGFWQFEAAGVRAVLDHPRTQLPIAQALSALRYNHTADAATVHPWLEHNDIAAACFARCLLWASPHPLPGPEDAAGGWDLYRAAWQPGRPRRSTWNILFRDAWERVQPAGLRPKRA